MVSSSSNTTATPVQELLRHLKAVAACESLMQQGLPPLIFFQKLYQAVHTMKGTLDLLPNLTQESREVTLFLDALRDLARRSKRYESKAEELQVALHICQSILKLEEHQSDSLISLLQEFTAKLSLATVYKSPSILLDSVHHLLKKQLKITLSDPLALARLEHALDRGHFLWTQQQSLALTEVQSFFEHLGECLPPGSYLVCHSLKPKQNNALFVELLIVVSSVAPGVAPKAYRNQSWSPVQTPCLS